MSIIYPLREYQTDLKTDIRNLFISGVKSVIMCSPTGSGKTVTFADIARDAVKNGRKVMILVDRRELLQQAQEKLQSYGLNPSLITSGRTARTNANCFIATVQTLVRRQTLPSVDLIIIDEAHKQAFDKVVGHDFYKNTFKIGATATPIRTGRMNQLADYYQNLVSSVSISSLIGQGFLVPAVTYGAKFDTSNIKIKGKDFDTSDMFDKFDKITLYKGVVEKYKKFSEGTKAIVFNINVEHSLKVTKAFKAAGYSAEHLDGNTPKSQRAAMLRAFHEGRIQILNNCDVLTTGFDEWTIETVIVNRSTKSVPLWLQMGGRGSRITPHPLQEKPNYLQKSHFNLIDMGGNVQRLGFWEDEREFSLKHKTRSTEGVAPVKECPEEKRDKTNKSGCGAIVRASAVKCPHCQFEFEIKKKEAVEGDFLQLVNEKRLPEELVGKSWGAMTIAELEKARAALGYKQGWILRQIIIREDLSLMDYAKFKKYRYPQAWVQKMESIYLKR